jgi:5'-3' exonuclease
MKRTVLIDGDEFVFRATAAIEQEIRWDEDNHVLQANEEEAWHNFNGMVRRICERFDVGSKDVTLCFSTTPNFRLTVDPTYKMHRKTARKPMCYAAIRQRVEGEYKVVTAPGLEADDVMGILATQPSQRQKIIVSQDKDMKTVPAHVWDGKDLHVITEAEADYRHMYQTLIGDTSDGYKGCPGVGPVKAEKILAKAKDYAESDIAKQLGVSPEAAVWTVVVDAYKKAGLTEADALTQARLARILRWEDWNKEKKEPILWTPHTGVALNTELGSE